MTPDLPALEALGKHVFFDPISEPNHQACASCHAPREGFTSPLSQINRTEVVVPGALPTTHGNRKPPTIGYASTSPNFNDCATDSFAVFCHGGVFWDGRAKGDHIGPEVFDNHPELEAAYAQFLGPVADQALGPFANDVEMNVPDGEDGGIPGAEFVCRHVQGAGYADLFEAAWGEPIDCEPDRVALSFKRIGVAISAWEHSAEVNSFSSKRDDALRQAGPNPSFPLAGLTDQENWGHDLFFGRVTALNPEGKDARCAACHNDGSGDALSQTYTDNRFHHLGIPPNHDALGFDPDAPDFGLSHHTDATNTGQSLHDGAFRTPTLRNVDKRSRVTFVKAYMHNGYFKTLEGVVHFYNTALVKRDPVACPPGTTEAEALERDCWPAPEVENGLDGSAFGLLGNLGLTPDEEAALVAYLKTLSDSETPPPPRRLEKGMGAP